MYIIALRCTTSIVSFEYQFPVQISPLFVSMLHMTTIIWPPLDICNYLKIITTSSLHGSIAHVTVQALRPMPPLSNTSATKQSISSFAFHLRHNLTTKTLRTQP